MKSSALLSCEIISCGPAVAHEVYAVKINCLKR